MKILNDNVLISIIIPIYNVSKYLDKCLETVTAQTYTNLEILIINDGSTDDSNSICHKWVAQDSRIIYVEKQNEGLGPTRNYGIELATGEYIAFVDSDDWIALDYVEKLYLTIKKENADIVECDFNRVYDYTEKNAYFNAGGMIGKEYTEKERILYGNVAQWNKITRRKLWLENSIRMPAFAGEDLAVNALLLVVAEKIANVHEALYYYRMGRSGSISNSIDKYYSYIQSAQYLIDSFKSRQLFLQNNELLYRHILRWVSRYLSVALSRLEETEYFNLRNKWMGFLDNNFPNRSKKSYLLMGGFNLGRIAVKLPFLEDPYHRFQFSNIISIMSDNVSKSYQLRHPNLYRQYMIQRDINKSFKEIVANEAVDFIIIDFIEERHGIIKVGNGNYTYSDALKELKELPFKTVEKCKEELKLWEDSCLKFIELLKTKFSPNQIFLVENYLTEYYGTDKCKKRFDNVEEIRDINKLLHSYYDYFENNFLEINIIKPSNMLEYFTDEKYEYGCYPWHLNEYVNIQIANDIENHLIDA